MSSLILDNDAVIVGAGFSGLHILHKLNILGFKSKVFEKDAGSGGVWLSNSFPGARVDNACCTYQYSDPKLYSSFNFREKYPARSEILQYFNHVEDTLGLRKYIQFNTRVTRAEFQEDGNYWKISTDDGKTTTARWFIICTGFASKPYIPAFPGLHSFAGEAYHTAAWPKDSKVDFKGKRVAVIGTGATGVQVIQEIGPQVSQMYVYQRTPNLALPMKQELLSIPNSTSHYPAVFEERLSTYAGLHYKSSEKMLLSQTEEERRDNFHKYYEEGGLALFLRLPLDAAVVPEANDMVYSFWREQTLKRISDNEKRELLAPEKAPHTIGGKRPSLEQNYFEVMCQENVKIIDVNISPILKITEKGIITENEGEVEVDIIALATGFDAVTGGILDIDILGRNGNTIHQSWCGKEGIRTSCGLAVSGFPNMFFLYGPQSPTGFSNGPCCIEIQGDFLTSLIAKQKEGITLIEAREEAMESWGIKVRMCWEAVLISKVDNWYQGSNVSGKKREPLCFAGGIPMYRKELEDCKESGFSAFLME